MNQFRFELIHPCAQTGARLETGRRRTSRNGAVAFTIIVFAAACALVLACAQLLAGGIGLAALVIAVVVGALAASSVHIVMEWERAVVMRFGRFNRVAGPGIVFTWPVIEFYTVRIDQRVAATYFGAEETLTSDLVPVNVDAVVFWMVFSPKKAAVEVEDYASAVAWMAQAMLRKAIGRASLAEVACRRDQLDAELKDELEAKLDGWGIDVIDVEVRDIVVPRELQPAMAAGAIAARERDARMTLAEARAYYEEQPPRGEYVLIVEGAPKQQESGPVSEEEALMRVQALLAEGLSRKDAVRQVAAETGLAKNQLYDAALRAQHTETE